MTLLHKSKAADGPFQDKQEGEEMTPSRRNWASSKPLIVQNPVKFSHKRRDQFSTLSQFTSCDFQMPKYC